MRRIVKSSIMIMAIFANTSHAMLSSEFLCKPTFLFSAGDSMHVNTKQKTAESNQTNRKQINRKQEITPYYQITAE